MAWTSKMILIRIQDFDRMHQFLVKKSSKIFVKVYDNFFVQFVVNKKAMIFIL